MIEGLDRELDDVSVDTYLLCHEYFAIFPDTKRTIEA